MDFLISGEEHLQMYVPLFLSMFPALDVTKDGILVGYKDAIEAIHREVWEGGGVSIGAVYAQRNIFSIKNQIMYIMI